MGLLSQKKAAAPVIRREVVAVAKPKPKPKLATNGHSLHKSYSTNGLRVPSSTHRSRPTPSASPRASPGIRQSASPRPPSSSSAEGDSRSRKRKLHTDRAVASAARTHRASPAFGSDSDSEEEGDWEERVEGSKRRKRTQAEDVDRVLAHKSLIAATLPEVEKEGALKFRKKANGERKEKELKIIHATDVASVKDTKCYPMWKAKEDEVAVELQYPGTRERER